ncbi:MAG TPA: branched-chain amino acid ABC transporter permease/ATP-binding protein [Gaiellaceae bacterium]|nr:branched-chain amino acid ABC transporter permease/ATP-binding protein [Gaiellaceae bacterium]
MSSAYQFFLLGLGVGAIYALAAQGIVLIYRGSGVVNFAQGAMAFVGAYAFFGLRNVDTPVVLALLGAAGATGAVGAVVYVAVMRPLRRASPLTRLVATLGVLTAVQGGGVLTFGSGTRFVNAFLPTAQVSILGARVGQDRLYLLAIAVTLSVALALVYRFTTFGLSTAAVAENELATAALGRSPDVIGATNWTIGAGLAGIAGALVTPIVGLSIGQLGLLLYPALAAALIGGFASFWWTLAGGLAIGVTESEVTRYVESPAWPPAVPFLAIVAILLLRGRALPLRSYLTDRFPRAGTGRVRWALVIPVLLAVLAFVSHLGASPAVAVATSASVALVGLSLVVVTGWAGQLSLAQFAMAGVGAFIAAKLASSYHLPFLAALAIGGLATVPVGLAIGLPALRTRGVNLAIATLGLALAVQTVIFGNPDYTGGLLGLNVDPPRAFGLDLNPTIHPQRYALFGVCCFTVLAVLATNVRRGRTGRRLLAVRASERAAASVGVSVVGAKLFAFAAAAGIAAVGGILLAFRTPSISFAPYNVDASINIVVTVVIGGIGYVGGVIPGALANPGGFTARIWSHLFNWDSYVAVVMGTLAILTVITAPDGIAHQITASFRSLESRFPRRRKPQAAPSVAVTPGAPRRRAASTLVVEDVSVRFGGVVALDGVSFTVHPGQITALIGPNGAGKTTLIDAVTGFTSFRGRIALDGHDLRRLAPHRRARLGIGRSFQAVELFDDLTVRDNLLVASDSGSRAPYLTDIVRPGRPTLSAGARAAIEECQLRDDLDRLPGELPFGRRRLVGIARAIAAEPSLLLLDEPAAGLSSPEVEEFDRLIRRLAREWRIGVLLVEHDVELVLGVSDEVVVLDFGRVIAQGAPADIRANPAVISAYLGTDDADAALGEAVTT